jgi:hypothetical protein
MKRTIALAIAALMSTTAWAHSGLFRDNIDTMDHVLLDVPEPMRTSESSMEHVRPEGTMASRDFYGTSQPEIVTRSIDQTLLNQGHDVVPDLYGNVILDVHPELIPAWSYR